MLQKFRAYTCITIGLAQVLFASLGLVLDAPAEGAFVFAIFGLIFIWWGMRILRNHKNGNANTNFYAGGIYTKSDYGLQWKLFKKHSWHALGLIGLNFLAFWFINIRLHVADTGMTTDIALRYGANFATLVGHGQIWRLVTSGFLHDDWGHLVGNMIALLLVGRYVDYYYGVKRFYLIYFATMVFGSLIGNITHPVLWGVGASGAVFGFYGAFFITFFIKHPDKRAVKFSKLAMIYMGGHILQTLTAGLGVAGVDNSAHLAGFVAGAGLGFVMLTYRYPATMVRDAVLASLAVMYVGMLFTSYRHAPTLQFLQAREKSLKEYSEIRKNVAALSLWMEKSQQSARNHQLTLESWHRIGKPELATIRANVYKIKTTSQETYQAQVDLYRAISMYESFFTDLYEGSVDVSKRAVASNVSMTALNLYKQVVDQVASAYKL